MTNEPGSTSWLVVGSIATIIGVVILVYALRSVYQWRKSYGWSYETLTALMALYPLGNGLKYLMVGPPIIRHHLADFGFTAFLAVVLYWRVSSAVRVSARNSQLSQLRQDEIVISTLRGTTLIALVSSYAYEVFTAVLYKAGRMEVFIVGRFDWIDIAAYTASAIACLLLIEHYARGQRRWHSANRQLTPTEKAAEREIQRQQMLAERQRRRLKKG